MKRVAWATTCLVVLVALHAWGALHSPTRLWAFDAMRYLASPIAWATWAIAAAACVPAIARPLESMFANLLAMRGWPLIVLLALTTWLLDDRTQVIGDFMVRQRAVEIGAFMVDFEPSVVGETLLFYYVPRSLAPLLGPMLAYYPRVLSLIELVVFTFVALRFVAALG